MGQMSEIFFMLIMPFFFARLGIKKMLQVGMLAWVGRYLLFAFGDNGNKAVMLYIGILLHGICYDFFFVTGQIYVDRKAPKEIQASAQGFLTLVTLGLGMIIGNLINGEVTKHYQITTAETVGHNWKMIWLIPCVKSFSSYDQQSLLFRENSKSDAEEEKIDAATEE